MARHRFKWFMLIHLKCVINYDEFQVVPKSRSDRVLYFYSNVRALYYGGLSCDIYCIHTTPN